MEQTRYLMWSRRGRPPPPLPLFGNSLISMVVGDGSSTYHHHHESWEEQAFAEDALGLLGGCSSVWPPRSYSCSFCEREFRSAQALGGHMNVHRRDRARLKQSSSSSSPGPTRSENPPAEHYYRPGAQIISSTTDQYCYSNINPNPISATVVEYMTTLLPPSYIPPPPITLEQQQIDSSNFPAIPPILPARRLLSRIPDLKLDIDNYWKLKDQMGALGQKRDQVLLDDEMVIKRRRFNPVVFPTIFMPTDKQLGSSPVEELDLELRLGDPPKIDRYQVNN